MRAAKEKTLNRLPDAIMQRMASVNVRQAATRTKPAAINRISNYDFTTRKFQKSPIGPTEKIRSIVPVVDSPKPRKRIGESRLQLRRSRQALWLMYFRARFYDPTTGEFISQDEEEYVDGYSMYRGYFLIGYVDVGGRIAVRPQDVGKEQEKEDKPGGKDPTKCTFKLCQSPTAGGAAGHLFIICGGIRFRAGPGRNPGDKPGTGRGLEDCACRTKGRGQLIPDVRPWDDKPIDHPESPESPYDEDKLKCNEITVPRSCNEVCGCFEKTSKAIYRACVKYKGIPGVLPGCSGNSNSYVAWLLKSCVVPENPIDIIVLPGAPTRPSPGVHKPLPKCVKEQLEGARR